MRPFLGSCRARRLILPSLVGMRLARVELGLHFRASSLFSFPHYLFLENGVVLMVFSFSACGRFSPVPRFLDLCHVYFRGWTRKSPSLWMRANGSLERGSERRGKSPEPVSAPRVCLSGRDAGEQPLGGGWEENSAAVAPLDPGGMPLAPGAPAGTVGPRLRQLQSSAFGRRPMPLC